MSILSLLAQGLVLCINLGLNARKFLKFIVMNRENFISFIKDSSSAKRSLVSTGVIENRQANTVEAYLETLEDTELEKLAVSLGYTEKTEKTITITNASSDEEGVQVNFLPSWKPFTKSIETESDGMQDVELCNVTLRRLGSPRKRANGTTYNTLKCSLADGTNITISSKDVLDLWFDNKLKKGDTVAIKSVIQKSAVLQGRPTQWYEGVVIIAGSDLVQDKFDERQNAKAEFAQLAEGAQLKVREQSEEKQAEDFLAKYGSVKF
jgi:hypothetical protein